MPEFVRSHFKKLNRALTVSPKQLILFGLIFVLVAGMFPGTPAMAAGPMVVDSLSGPITQNEINSFKSYIQTVEPVVWPNTGSMQGEYAQGKSGENIKAMGLMYELTGDTAILDRMIYFVDVLLSSVTISFLLLTGSEQFGRTRLLRYGRGITRVLHPLTQRTAIPSVILHTQLDLYFKHRRSGIRQFP